MTDGCSGCGCPFPRTEEYYSKDASSPDGFNRRCKYCESDRVSKHYYSKQFEILEKRYRDYHDPKKIDGKRAYFAKKRREYRERDRAAAS